MPGGKADLLKSRLWTHRKWAARGVLELISIRNAIVRNNSIWNQKTIKELALANVAELPQAGTPLQRGSTTSSDTAGR